MVGVRVQDMILSQYNVLCSGGNTTVCMCTSDKFQNKQQLTEDSLSSWEKKADLWVIG